MYSVYVYSRGIWDFLGIHVADIFSVKCILEGMIDHTGWDNGFLLSGNKPYTQPSFTKISDIMQHY